MKGIATAQDVYVKGRLPQSEAEWLALRGVDECFVPFGGQDVQCAVFRPDPGYPSPTELTLFIGGIPRDSTRRSKLPVVNKLFGYAAAGTASAGQIGVNFNWPGQGSSSGDILSTSIDTRVRFLAGFTDFLAEKHGVDRIHYVGASMGAYCAAMAADFQEIEKLGFLSPAAYPAQAHDRPYNNGFNDAIGKPWDAASSPVFSVLRARQRPVLTAFSEFDDPPIPVAIQTEYALAATDSNYIEHHIIAGVCHNFRRPVTAESINIVDNEAIRAFGKVLTSFLEK